MDEGKALADSADACWSSGMVCEAQGRLEKAEAAYAQALAIDPLHPGALFNQGLILHRRGDTEAAVLRLAEARDKIGPTLAIDWHLAMLHELKGRFGEAEFYYRSVLQLAPDHGPSLISLGCVRRAANCIEESESLLRRAEEILPERADVSWQLGITLEMKGCASESEQAYRRALAKSDEPRFHESLGLLLRWQERPAEAVIHYERAADLVFRKFEDARRSVKHIPSIVTAFMPKSGGTHLANTMRKNVGLVEAYFGVFSILDYSDFYIVDGLLRRYLEGGCFSHNHMSATPYNVERLKAAGARRIWVHVRDPRQAVLSGFQHYLGEDQGEGLVAEQRRAENREQIEIRARRHGKRYSEIDDYLRAFYPWFLKWIADWNAVAESGEVDVMFTTFENFLRRPGAFYSDVWRNFLPGCPYSCPSTAPQPEDRYRKGLEDEWRTALTEQQKARLIGSMPPWMYTRFGWVP